MRVAYGDTEAGALLGRVSFGRTMMIGGMESGGSEAEGGSGSGSEGEGAGARGRKRARARSGSEGSSLDGSADEGWWDEDEAAVWDLDGMGEEDDWEEDISEGGEEW